MNDWVFGGAAHMPVAASFRDPAGSLFFLDQRVFRIINASGVEDLNAFVASGTGRKWIASGRVVGTNALNPDETGALLSDAGVKALYDAVGGKIVVEHERIALPSFPYEWAPEMLHAAALLTIDLAQDLLQDGLGLKDGSPYNVLFRGTEPVFIDVLSCERRDARDATWLPYAQFVRTFLLPLMANRYFGLALDQILMTRRDGLEPEDVYRWTGPLQRLWPPFLSLVSIPKWLGARHDQDDVLIYQHKTAGDPEQAQFILASLLKWLRKTLRKVAPAGKRSSAWSGYMTANNHYSRAHFEAKQEFVQAVLAEFGPKHVLDVGCNTGHFSAIAARAGASVVAIDYDPVVVGEVWCNARAERLDILPLVVNLTRPTPAIGWLNRENASFLERARGKFDAVLMLAVVHHMLVTERIPLAAILQLAADLTTDLAVIEFIAPEDSMFRRLTRGRDELHRGLNAAVFEQHCRRYFEIVRVQHLSGTHRWLYLLRKSGGRTARPS